MKTKILAVMAATALALGAAGTASASITAGAAEGVGSSIARDDCGRAYDWYCSRFPLAGPATWSCATNRWCVRVWYQEGNVFVPWQYRGCMTETHFGISDGGYYYHSKSC
jgi:hypothetical protein